MDLNTKLLLVWEQARYAWASMDAGHAERYGQKLCRVIVLHFGVVSFRFDFGRDPLHSHDLGYEWSLASIHEPRALIHEPCEP